MSPVSNFPSTAVMVWATWSLLVTVTLAPGATVTVLGEKAKFLMVMAVVPAGAAPPDAVVVVGVGAVVDVVADAAWVVEVVELPDGLALPPEEQAAKGRCHKSMSPLMR